MSGDSQGPLGREACLAYLSENTFRLRSGEYGETYPQWPGAVGLEIEMLPVDPRLAKRGVPASVPLHGPGLSTAELLKSASPSRGWTPRLESGIAPGSQDATLMSVLMEHGDALTFEPGGQLEFSSKPYPCLADAVERMNTVQAELDRIYSSQGLAITQVGINPWHTLDELGLQMPKPRYRAMDRYYSQIGPYGQRMMRQTCTVQVNLDFGADEMILAKRYLASQLVSPFATAMFAYSPVVDRKQTGVRGFRSRIWRHTDPTHTGLPGLEAIAARLNRATCIATYLEAVLSATVVFIEDLAYKVPAKPITFGEWLDQPIDGVRPRLKDLATHLSLMFPEVRPRGFLELRSIDCQARAWQYVPAYFYTGLLYDRQTVDRLIDLLLPYREQLEALLCKAELGLEDPTLAKLSAQVVELAQEGFSRLSPCFKARGAEKAFAAFASHFTLQGRTPADDVLDAMQREKESYMTFATYRSLEERWATYSV